MKPYCLSNDVMVGLLHWRNANPTVGKIVVTELTLPFIAVAATVQTIFFDLLLFLTLPIYIWNGSQTALVKEGEHMVNAGVTVGMSIANFFFYNFCKEANTLSMVGWDKVYQDKTLELVDLMSNASNVSGTASMTISSSALFQKR